MIYRLLVLITIFSYSSILKANYCGRFLDNLTSPICTDASYIFWTGSLITTGLLLSKHQTSYQLRQEALKKRYIRGEWGPIGDTIGWGYMNAAYSLIGMFSASKKAKQNGEMMAEASLYTFGMTMLLKSQISEARPGYPNYHDSFPSGHASISFAFASVVTANNGIMWGTLAHLFALYVSFNRITEDWHYLHDVVAGVTIGMSYGWGIYLNHTKHKKPYWLTMLPTDDLHGGKFLLGYQF